ncbi:hypothetical protein M3Y97_00593400 [Aphelenchoides bicaudatus]|nr:hypothetical protein M3Y97_00593400 [Aphelenchoides bicaudatus]
MISISTLFLVNEVLGVSLGFIANAALYFLIQNASPTDLNSYKRLLKLHCFTDLLYTTINGLTSLRILYIGKHIFLVVAGPLAYWRSYGALVASSLLTFAFISELTFVPIDFYYRYVLVCRNDPFTNLRFGVCVFTAAFITTIYTMFSAYTMTYGPTNDTLKHWMSIQKALSLGKKQLPFSFNDPDSPKTTLTLIFCSSIAIAAYLVIGLATYRIHQMLAENARRQVRKESSHVRQITLVMIIQALLPFFALAVPILVVTICMFARISIEMVGYLITLSISWTPVLKPLITIYVIRPYRRAVKRKIFGEQATTTADTSVSNTETQSTNLTRKP